MDEKFDVETTKSALQNTRLVIGPRPGKKSIDMLAALNLTHCCTLLSEREDVQPIRKICKKLGCDWIWLPIEGGKLDILRQTDLKGHVQAFVQQTKNVPTPHVYIHCSAGIHRTGFFVYVLLRLRGLDREAANVELSNIRAVTAEQVGPERLDLADELVASLTSP